MPIAIIFIVLALIGFVLLIISIGEEKLQYSKWVILLVAVVLLLGFWLIVSYQGLIKVDDGICLITCITGSEGQIVPIIYFNGELINMAEKTKANVPVDSQVNVSHYANSWGLDWMRGNQYKVVNKKQ